MILRPATWEDRFLLLEWRNEEETRRSSLSQEPVSLEQHERWLQATLSGSQRRLYVAEEEGVPVGTVRIDGGELSWTVAPTARGRGVGKRLVATGCALVEGAVLARILPGNAASLAIARHCGFVFLREEEGVTWWERPPRPQTP